MSIRTYTAESMTAAYALVKRHLGDRAVILQTRTVKRGGLFGIGARTCVQIIAADEGDVRSGPRKGGTGRAAPSPAAASRAGRSGARKSEPAVSPNAGDLIRTVYQAARTGVAAPTMGDRVDAASRHDHLAISGAAPPPPVAPAPRHEADGTGEGVRDSAPGRAKEATDASLQREMTAVRRMVSQLLLRPGGEPVADGSGGDRLVDQYLHLLEQDVSRELADDIVVQVRAALSPEQLADPAQVRSAVAGRLEAMLPIDAAAGQWSPTRTGSPRVIALVGPTGVGKTTTVAKMAANFKLKGKCDVGLITIDTYRIAAVDQLRTYADIIGVPLHVVLSPRELQDALRRCAGCDVVLIDTAGRSQRDDEKLEELGAFITAASPDEVHLVLSSTCSPQVVLDTVDRFSRIDVDRVIFTKLDEAVTVGVVLNAVNKINKRLSFVTTGQDVPHHIESGGATSIVARMLGEGG